MYLPHHQQARCKLGSLACEMPGRGCDMFTDLAMTLASHDQSVEGWETAMWKPARRRGMAWPFSLRQLHNAGPDTLSFMLAMDSALGHIGVLLLAAHMHLAVLLFRIPVPARTQMLICQWTQINGICTAARLCTQHTACLVPA